MGAMEQTLERLRHMIISGELAPGEQIRQQEMADQFGVSRVPLREAMSVLATESLLLHKPRQGYFVTKRAPGELAQIRRMLHVLENELIQTVAWPDKKALARLKTLNGQMRTFSSRPDWIGLAALNREFHFFIYDLSPDRVILQEVERFWLLTDSFTLVKFERPEARAKTVEEHELIIDALAAQDRRAFRRAMDHHRSSSMEGVNIALAGGRDPHGLRRMKRS
jgi:DNA-binding GntR family transcriptional regulator